jgi:hypothetical protein
LNEFVDGYAEYDRRRAGAGAVHLYRPPLADASPNCLLLLMTGNLQFLPRFGIILGHIALRSEDVNSEETWNAHEN